MEISPQILLGKGKNILSPCYLSLAFILFIYFHNLTAV